MADPSTRKRNITTYYREAHTSDGAMITDVRKRLVVVADAADTLLNTPRVPTTPLARPLPDYNTLLKTHLNHARMALDREYIGEELMRTVLGLLEDAVEGVREQRLSLLVCETTDSPPPSPWKTPPTPTKRLRGE